MGALLSSLLSLLSKPSDMSFAATSVLSALWTNRTKCCRGIKHNITEYSMIYVKAYFNHREVQLAHFHIVSLEALIT